jgi:hypothetical protein
MEMMQDDVSVDEIDERKPPAKPQRLEKAVAAWTNYTHVTLETHEHHHREVPQAKTLAQYEEFLLAAEREMGHVSRPKKEKKRIRIPLNKVYKTYRRFQPTDQQTDGVSKGLENEELQLRTKFTNACHSPKREYERQWITEVPLHEVKIQTFSMAHMFAVANRRSAKGESWAPRVNFDEDGEEVPITDMNTFASEFLATRRGLSSTPQSQSQSQISGPRPLSASPSIAANGNANPSTVSKHRQRFVNALKDAAFATSLQGRDDTRPVAAQSPEVSSKQPNHLSRHNQVNRPRPSSAQPKKIEHAKSVALSRCSSGELGGDAAEALSKLFVFSAAKIPERAAAASKAPVVEQKAPRPLSASKSKIRCGIDFARAAVSYSRQKESSCSHHGAVDLNRHLLELQSRERQLQTRNEVWRRMFSQHPSPELRPSAK